MAVKLERGRGLTFGRGKRWLGRLEVVVGVFLIAYIVLVANVIVFRHPLRFDLTQEELHTLSRETRDRLRLVGEEIRVVIPTLLTRNNPRHIAEREVLERSRQLLEEYVAAQPLIKIVAEIDVLASSDRWSELCARFSLTPTQINRFIFIAGAANEYRQSVTPQDMATFGSVKDPALDVPEIHEFRGEKTLTSALTRLIERQRRPVYFTQDKGEPSVRPLAAGAASGVRGSLNELRHELETTGYEARPLDLGAREGVPADCELLVIAAPFQAYSEEELDILQEYLDGGGRLFLALDPAVTGIENRLANYGIGVKPGVLEGRRASDLVRNRDLRIGVRTFNSEHPITAVFQQAPGFAMGLTGVRALEPGGRERGWDAVSLLAARPEPGGVSYVLVRDGGGDEVLEKGDGGFTLAVAVKQLEYQRPPADFRPKAARLVVVGAANFLKDGAFPQGSHRDFFLNSVAWLTGREERSSLGNQEWRRRTLDMSEDFRRYLRWVPTLVFPGIFLFLGAFVYYLRRS